MPSGLDNLEKVRIRQLFAEGKVDRDALLEAELKSYHSPGTCTFYGTANSNQLLMEVMGLHLPGASFVNPNTPMRKALTAAATHRVAAITALGDEYTPLSKVLDELAFVNGIVALLASGGSTNHTLHLVAIAAAAGIKLTWDDFGELSEVVPLLCRIYPNGKADVNHFQAAGGIGGMIRELLHGGLLHDRVTTVAGRSGLARYTEEPFLERDRPVWRQGPTQSLDLEVVSSLSAPFNPNGGLKVLSGNLGRAVIKTSAVKPQHRRVQAPAMVFEDQAEMLKAFKAGDMDRDAVVVVRFQGPRANGMPELHQLSPALGVLQDKGYHVALVTDGRMSGASGKVPAAIHVAPEAVRGGALAKLRNGDPILLDGEHGILEALVGEEEWAQREAKIPELSDNEYGMGRELFAGLRDRASGAEDGASFFRFGDLVEAP